MAKRSAQDTAAAKAKKQKMILIVGGVLLLAVAAFQGPKLMKRGGSTAAPAPAAAPRSAHVRHTRAGRSHGRPRQGLRRRRGRCPAARRGRQGRRRASSPRSRSSRSRIRSSRRSATESARRRQRHLRPIRRRHDRHGHVVAARLHRLGAPPATGDSAGRPPAPIIYATIDFNTKPQQVQVKGTFPTPEPLFVLRSLTKKQAKISVAGGSFDGGKPVTLKLGKKVTLVNTATGVRYVLKLVYTGAQPEVIEGFTTTPAERRRSSDDNDPVINRVRIGDS